MCEGTLDIGERYAKLENAMNIDHNTVNVIKRKGWNARNCFGRQCKPETNGTL